MAAKKFELGDLVWAKMKNYPFWPAQIVNPPVVNEKALDTDKGLPKKKPTSRRNQHFVFFYGTRNFSWMLDENIVPHSEEMANRDIKKKSASYIKAVKEITKASRGEDSVDSENSPGSPEISKKRGRRSKRKVKRRKKSVETQNLDPTTDTQQPFATDTSNEELSPLQNITTVSNDHSAAVVNIPQDIDDLLNNLNDVCFPTDTQQPFAADASNKLSSVTNFSTVSNNHSAAAQNIDRVSDYSEFEYFPPLNHSGKAFILPTSKKIGFIGLGMIGQKIAARLINSGHNVSVWNRTREKCRECVAAGARQFSTPEEIALNCDIIFCCVSGAEAVRSVVLGNCGIVYGLGRCEPGSKGYIELTSMDPSNVQEISKAITSRGVKYLEAPISGSISNAEEGLLLVLATGNRQLFEDCVSCFYAFAKRICFMNCEVGSASKMNIVLSMLRGSTISSLAESTALLENGKLLHGNFKKILPLSQMSSPFVLQKCEAMMKNNFSVDNSLKYQQKDLELAIQLSNEYRQPCPMTSAALGIYQTATQRGYSELDVSALHLARLDT